MEQDRWEKLKQVVREVVGEELDARGLKAKTKLAFSNGKWIGATQEQISAWKEAYPAVDIETQLKLAAAWIVSNPTMAPKSNFARFLNTWLTKEQNRASLHAIPTARSIAQKTCAYCERPASGSVGGISHCQSHTNDAMDGLRPLGSVRRA